VRPKNTADGAQSQRLFFNGDCDKENSGLRVAKKPANVRSLALADGDPRKVCSL
jgi:hypothetical protein